jgi:16S rRNA (guanine527-N7)-methyltransferase
MKDAPELLRKGLDELGLPYTGTQIEAFSAFLAELKKWNKAYNLTGLRADEDIVIKHFLDSLLFLTVLPPHVRSIADIGSGAGFPGMPLKIMSPDLEMLLVEPTRKKALFLEHMKRTLGLGGLEVINKTIEEVRDLQVDAAVTRALFSVRDFMAKAVRLLKPNGVLVLSKGPGIVEEIRGIDMQAIQLKEIILPLQGSIRYLVIIQNQSS